MTLWLLIIMPQSIIGYAPTQEACLSRGREIARALSEVQGKRVDLLCKPVEEVD